LVSRLKQSQFQIDYQKKERVKKKWNTVENYMHA